MSMQITVDKLFSSDIIIIHLNIKEMWEKSLVHSPCILNDRLIF